MNVSTAALTSLVVSTEPDCSFVVSIEAAPNVIATIEPPVMRPSAVTLKTGMLEEVPYVPAATPDGANLKVSTAALTSFVVSTEPDCSFVVSIEATPTVKATTEAPVMRPSAVTLKTGMFEVEPYVAAATPEGAS